MPELSYKSVEFSDLFTSVEDLNLYRPELPGNDWAYLGPVASTGFEDQHGLIVKANNDSALTDIVNWQRVFSTIEYGNFSTWRGIPDDPSRYTAIGHIIIPGTEAAPSYEDTAGIKAIRNDLIGMRQPDHLVWKYSPEESKEEVLTLWDVLVTDLLHVPTGAFVSKSGTNSQGLEIGALLLDA